MKREDLPPEVRKALESLHLIQITTGNVGQLMEFENKFTENEAAILETIRRTVSGIEAELSEIKRLLPGTFNK